MKMNRFQSHAMNLGFRFADAAEDAARQFPGLCSQGTVRQHAVDVAPGSVMVLFFAVHGQLAAGDGLTLDFLQLQVVAVHGQLF